MRASTHEQTTPAPEATVGEIVANDIRTAAIFEKHGIDFCCGGKIPLSDICREKGLDPALLRQEIAQLNDTPVDRNRNYAAWPLPFLADYIVNTHHAYLNGNTAQIAAYAEKIAAVHGAHHPEVIEIAAIFRQIASDMTDHLRHEEEVLFPALARIDAARKAGTEPDVADRETIRAALVTLDREHQVIGDAVHSIRHLANGYALPGGVCATYALTYRMLKEFEDDLHMHVHLENNILFPKAGRL